MMYSVPPAYRNGQLGEAQIPRVAGNACSASVRMAEEDQQSAEACPLQSRAPIAHRHPSGVLMVRSKAIVLSFVVSSVALACGESSGDPPSGVVSTPLKTFNRAYLHRKGGDLSLDSTAPNSPAAAKSDSGKLEIAGGNRWVDLGTWTATPALSSGIVTVDGADVWVGLKDGHDEGTNFDIRAEVRKNGTTIASSETLCIRDLTKKRETELFLSLAALPLPFDGSSDVLSLTIATRMGTDGAGASCGGPTRSGGLRMYFDGADERSSVGMFIATGCSGNTPDADCPTIRCTTSARRPGDTFPLWTYVEPDVKVFRLTPTVVDLYSAGVARAERAVPPVRFRSTDETSNDYVGAIINVAPDLHQQSVFGTTVNGFFQLAPFSLTTREPFPGGTTQYTIACSGLTTIRTGPPPLPVPFPY
jgi:hypothetical protein